MWFMLNTTFSEYLDSLDNLQSSYSISYTLTGLSKASNAVSNLDKSKTSFTTYLTLKSNYTWDSSSTIAATGATSCTATLSGSTLTVSVSGVTGSVGITAKATYTGSAGGDSNDGSTTTPTETDITSLFDFTIYPTTVINMTTTGNSPRTQSSSYFDSTVANIAAYAGKSIKIMIPKYTSSSGAQSMNATYIVKSETVENNSDSFVTMLKLWDTSDNGAKTGTLTEYTLTLPSDAQYLWTSIFNDAAISAGIGNTGFYCKVIS